MKNFKNKKIKNKGFVILFAVVLTTIILSVSLGLTEITYKEIGFGTQAKNTGDAFYAADTGIECALYYDIKGAETDFGAPVSPFGYAGGDLTALQCAGTTLPYTNFTGAGPWTFVLYNLAPSGKSCAVVRLDKTTTPGTTRIISKGYNVGETITTTTCTSTNPNRVEREIELSYPS